jgi:hypothetical protein
VRHDDATEFGILLNCFLNSSGDTGGRVEHTRLFIAITHTSTKPVELN